MHITESICFRSLVVDLAIGTFKENKNVCVHIYMFIILYGRSDHVGQITFNFTWKSLQPMTFIQIVSGKFCILSRVTPCGKVISMHKA